jgi:hypothetical protein
MESKEQKMNRGLKVGLGIVIVLFLASLFYAYTLYTDGENTRKQLTAEKENVIQDLNEMQQQYDVAIGENEVANAKLLEARDRIQGLIDSLQTSEASVRSLWRYRSRYNNLKAEMDVLLAENDSLRVANTELAVSLDSTQLQLEERTVFGDSLLAQNTELAGIVEEAAVLSTAGLKGFGVIVRSSGKLIPTERAGRTDKIRVCYTVTKNSLVESGNKEFYVQVLDPRSNVLGLNQEVSFEESIFSYSLISSFNYENSNLDICEFVEATGADKFEKGRYAINIFDGPRLVSTSEFELR